MYIGVHLRSEKLKQIGTKLKALKGLSLEKQCKREGIPLKKVELSVEKSDEPEVQAKYHLLNKKDYDYDHVYFMENSFSFLFHIMFFNYVWNHKSSFYSTSKNLIFKEEHKENLLNVVRNMNREKFKQNMEAMNEKWNAPGNKNKRIRKDRREKFLNISLIYFQQ